MKPKTARGKRVVEKRAPRTVETLKKALLLHGGKTSQVVKVLFRRLRNNPPLAAESVL